MQCDDFPAQYLGTMPTQDIPVLPSQDILTIFDKTTDEICTLANLYFDFANLG